jgi:hypothetical protein
VAWRCAYSRDRKIEVVSERGSSSALQRIQGVIDNFRDWYYHLVKTNSEPVGNHQPRSIIFRIYAPFSLLLHFLNASWKSCSVKMFSTSYDSASITSVLWKWPLFILRNREKQERRPNQVSKFAFGEKFPGEKGSVRLYVSVIQQPVLSS